MDLIEIIVLAIVQGITEFLPISSSAHLILTPKLLGWQDQGLAFDVAVHVGTLLAVMTYFRHQITKLIYDWLQSLTHHHQIGESQLAWAIIVGTIPAGIAGLLLNDLVATTLRSPLVIASTTLVFGILLWWSDSRGKKHRDEYQLTLFDILFIGCAQAIAIIPGTSRSGITITAALMRGLNRPAAARFSFLLSIPIIIAAGSLKTRELLEQQMAVDWSALLLAVVLAAFSAYFCIHYFLRLLDRLGMLPFVIYRLLLGGFLFFLYI